MSLYVEHMTCCLLLVPCALPSIVCPLPSCYLIHCFTCFTCVSLVTLVCLPIYPPGVCSLLLIRCFTSCVCYIWLCTVLCLPAFLFIIKKTHSSCIWVLAPSLLMHPDRTDQPLWGLSRGRVCVVHHPPLSPTPFTTHPPVWGPDLLPSAGQ